ncbi:hypothetical protein ISS86_02175, partial [Candidatus Microgenomates bacterium]|nr:hypothetical protein [Candidatus Microgenomates bacterium]
MARAVTADHIKFSECIDIFKSRENIIKKDNKRFYGYLFLDFKLPLSWQFLDFDIHETLGDWNNQILLVSPYSAFVAPVLMPQWVDRHNGHLFTIALSSVASFCTGRSIKSTRDDYCIDKKITNRPKELAIQHTVLTAGPGGYNTNLSSKSLLEFKKRIDE